MSYVARYWRDRNPWSPDHYNLTNQMHVAKEYPELADELKRHAEIDDRVDAMLANVRAAKQTFMGIPVKVDDTVRQNEIRYHSPWAPCQAGCGQPTVEGTCPDCQPGAVKTKRHERRLEAQKSVGQQGTVAWDVEAYGNGKYERLAGYPIDSKSPTKLTPEAFVDAVNKAYESFDGLRYDEVHIDEAKSFGIGLLDRLHSSQRKVNKPSESFEKLVDRIDMEDCHVDTDEDGCEDWDIWVPCSIACNLTPDTAPELERRLTLALRILKEGK